MIFEDISLGLDVVGELRRVNSLEIEQSGVSVGMECLDREMFDFEKCYKQAAAIGIKWARCQTGWARCEKTKGKYDFSWLDNIVDKLTRVGIQPWFNVSYGNSIYMPGVSGAAVGQVPLYYGDEALTAWKNYLLALASHFGGRVARWEIWNEPEISNFWRPVGSDPVEYAKLVRISADAIKGVVADAEIGACSFRIFTDWFFPKFVATGIGKILSFYAVHNYSIQPEKDFRRTVETLKRLFAKHDGAHVEIYQGEAGYASFFPPEHWMGTYICNSEINQAKWLLRRYATDFSAGIKLSSFFQMADMMKPYETADRTTPVPARHGLLDGLRYEPKLSYAAMANVAAIFDNETIAQPLYGSVITLHAIPRCAQVSKLANVAVVLESFIRKGFPLYLYYLPEDVQLGFYGLKNIQINILPGECGKKIVNPVLIDMLSGRVYKTTKIESNSDGINLFSCLPLTDYPLIITDLEAIDGRMQNTHHKIVEQ